MREILFRGKRIDNGEWVEGFLVVVGKWYYIFTGKLDVTKGGVEFARYEVIPETVGQYTGLTDKNGKKIFEGDILKLHGRNLPHWYSKGQNVVVKYNNVGYEPMCEYDSDCGEYVESNECEVIGNIHDNPELLEVSGDE